MQFLIAIFNLNNLFGGETCFQYLVGDFNHKHKLWMFMPHLDTGFISVHIYTAGTVRWDWGKQLHSLHCVIDSRDRGPVGKWTFFFGGKLRNPYFGHIFGIRRQIFLRKKGMYWLGPGFKIGLNEK